MKIQILSDLHLEFGSEALDVLKRSEADVVVVAGDLHVGVKNVVKSLKKISDIVKTPVVYVPGNHEYYGCSGMPNFNSELFSYDQELESWSIYALNCDVIYIEDVAFIGAVGWTDGSYMKYNPKVGYLMSDIFKIPGFREGRGGQDWGEDDVHAIETSLLWHDAGKKCVITHHAPSAMSLKPKYYNNELNTFFINDWNYLMDDYTIDLWVHGHCHDSHNYKYNKTRVVCNPFGYTPYAINDGFNPNLIVEI